MYNVEYRIDLYTRANTRVVGGVCPPPPLEDLRGLKVKTTPSATPSYPPCH